jgi:predicted alpha/beta hydrolase family esterase
VAILFLHGAGGYADGQAIVAALRAGVGDEIRMPDLGDADMSHATWSAHITAHLASDVDIVVGHSFGGSTVLKLLTESRLDMHRLVLMAVPDWGPDGWDVAEYALPDDADQRLAPGLSIELHHCLDDEVVPADHVDLIARRLPRATVVRHARGGHQFAGDALDAVIQTLREPRPRQRGAGPTG